MSGFGRVFQPRYKARNGELKTCNTWRWELWIGGKRHSGPARTEAAANRILKQKLGEAESGQFIGRAAERYTFEEAKALLFDDYRINGKKSLRRAEASVKRLEEFFGPRCRMVDITADRIGVHIRSRLDAKAKPATVQKELAALKRIFRLAVRARKITLAQVPYIPTLEIRNTRTGFFTESELRAVQAHLSEDVRPVVEFMFWTGWRTGEVLALQWRNVDIAGGVVRLDAGTTKNDDGRELPFGILPKLRVLLERQRARTEEVQRETKQIITHVFHRGGAPIKDFLNGWHSACRKAGIPGRRPHDFRRTAVRRFEAANIGRSRAMAMTGHKTEAVYRRYAIVTSADLRDAMAKVAAMVAATDDASSEPAPARVVGIDTARHATTAQVPRKSGRRAASAAIVSAG